MSKIADPINPDTEVTREDISTMAGCSLCKVGFATSRKKWGFPQPVRRGQKGRLLYCRTAVTAWLAANDLKTMVFAAEDRAPARDFKQEEKGIDSNTLALLSVGIKPVQSQRTGKSYRVRTEEHHEYPEPRRCLSLHSNSGAEHRYVGTAL